MYKKFIPLILFTLSHSVHAENLKPFQIDAESPVCAFPNIKFPADLIVYGAGAVRGREIDHQIDESGNTATQIDVAVNKPGKPIALILGGSRPTIWNIGWTKNTNIVVVFVSGYERQRISGLKQGTPIVISSYADKGPCHQNKFIRDNFTIYEMYDSFDANFKFGEEPDLNRLKAEQKLSQILFSKPLNQIFKVSNDGKVVMGDPLRSGEKLISSDITPPDSFYTKSSTLAGAAGLQQAINAGVIRRANIADAESWSNALTRKYAIQNKPPPNLPPNLDNAFVVLKPFTYPPGLKGSNRATFYIAEGVPDPKGDIGDCTIFDMNSITMTCKMGTVCGQAIMSGEVGSGAVQSMTIDGSR